MGGARQQSILLGISSEESYAVFQSLLRDFARENSGKLFRLFSDFDTGAYYENSVVQYRRNRPLRFVKALRGLMDNIEFTTHPFRMTDLNERALVHVSEYMARAFEREYPFHGNVTRTLRRIRTSMHGIINITDVQLDENIELRSGIRSLLQMFDRGGTSHAAFRHMLKDIFVREVFRGLRRP